MYCNNCGNNMQDSANFCNNCGAKLIKNQSKPNNTNDSSVLFAILGFLIPLVGLILFLVYLDNEPKRAKSAGKGALIGVIISVVLAIILCCILFSSIFHFITNGVESHTSLFVDDFDDNDTKEILGTYADVTFGDFTVTNDGYINKTSLEVTVKNISDRRCSYVITVEAVDENGARLDTEIIYADRLKPNQEMSFTAFGYVPKDQITEFENATFDVLEINQYYD